MLLIVLTLALLSFGQAQEYHYPRPHIPFHLSPQRPVRQPPTRYIVQTLGPHGRTYELQAHKAPAIYVAHQTVTVPGRPQLQQQQQQQQHHHQIQHQLQQPPQQLPFSAYKNPLLVNTNYQQTSVSLTAPPPPAYNAPAQPISYYGQPHPQAQAHPQVQAQAQAQAQGQFQSNVQQSADSYYTQPQALTAATATQSQPATHYGQPQLQEQRQQQQPHVSNPQPYATVTLPHGERVLDAGHGSGPTPADSGHSSVPPRVGDYSAQSPTAALDTYNYKQAAPGDTRSYQRYITNCQGNGQCQQLTLSPGQIDGDHQQLLQAARSKTQAAAPSCTHSFHVPPGAEQNDQGQLRPRGRRTYQHVQEQLDKYPYN